MNSKGFTIVELLIVIVVIGILASITVVTYRGVQQRATIVRIKSDLKSINNALEIYYADNGVYPLQTSWNTGKAENFIPNLVPSYTGRVPQHPDSRTTARYMYRSDATGANYKLMSHTDDLCTAATANEPSLIDPVRNCWAYGYWSSGGSSL